MVFRPSWLRYDGIRLANVFRVLVFPVALAHILADTFPIIGKQVTSAVRHMGVVIAGRGEVV